MITGKEFLHRLEEVFPGSVRRNFAFPFTYVDIVSADVPTDPDEREEFLATRTRVDVPIMRALCNRLFLRLEPRRPEEADERPANRGEFWMRALQGSPLPEKPPSFRVIHFYGYKGGQGRSTLLAFLSMVLATDGWRVLSVDMDAEAPSLDVLYGTAATEMSATILGLRAELQVQPLRAFTPSSGNGYVNLMPFRPPDQRYDLDAAALTMELGIHPPSQQTIIQRLYPLIAEHDVVLIDHRTGLAPTVLPWVAGLPGPVVAFARMDGQWRGVRRHLGPLWGGNSERPGVLVSALPPGEDETAFMRDMEEQALDLLDELADAYSNDVNGEEVAAEDLVDHWVLWPYDPGFGRPQMPDLNSVGGQVLQKLAEVRRLLELTGEKTHPSPVLQPPVLHPSGGSDEGHLIQTRALRDLSASNSPYTFILGRKGTGKTRLVRELAMLGLGQPLLVASDFPESAGGLVRDTLFDQHVDQTEKQPESFWWTILGAALQGADTNRKALRARVEALRQSKVEPIDACREVVRELEKPRTFLIDGLETSFFHERTFAFLGALFRVVAALEADPDFRERVIIRIFVRTDLAQRGFENFEQQSHGRKLDLVWDTQSILNFALSRIEQLPWFSDKFPQAADVVRKKLPALKEGALRIDECDALLMLYFPPRLGRSNINTTTFLRTWFSDAPKAETSFYPRVYDDFLRVIAGEDRGNYADAEVQDGRLAPSLIYHAHARATENFLSQVKSELLHIVDLTESKLTNLLDVMRGTITPFVLEKRAGELAERSGLDVPTVRQAMERMKRLGIFEDRPKFPGQWRVGRLFKSSLGMIYDRRRRRDPDELPESE